MTVALTKDSIDLGIVVRDADAMVAFYRDLLGFEDTGTMDMPDGSTMYRLLCGTSLIKLVAPKEAPPATRATRGHLRRDGLSLLDDLGQQPRRDHGPLRARPAGGSSSRRATSGPACGSRSSRTPTATGWSS